MAANAGEEQRKKPRGAGKRFEAGKSGNPEGRSAGTRNRATVAIEVLLEGEAEAIGRKAIEMALDGDSMAMRLCLERLAPVRRGRPVHFTLPTLNGPSDLVRALAGILTATAAGELSPDEASQVASIFEAKRRAMETTELETRLAALEKAAGA